MSLRLAHVSDLHFGAEHPQAIEACLEAVMAAAPDLVAVTGDLTLDGRTREFAAARAWLGRLDRPKLITPGNHDTPYLNLPLRTFTPFRRYRRFIGPADEEAYEGPGLSARALNSARGFQLRPDWSKGVADLDEIGRAAADLAMRPAGLKVFACHHPLIDPPHMPVGGGVHGGEEAAQRLVRAGVDLILSGHTHVPFVLPLEGGERPAYAIGAGTLSLRTRGAPPSFTMIDVEDETLDVHVMGWTGSAFAVLDHWPLPRTRRPAGTRARAPRLA
ncbi:MAG TPA: metallophosphoesterase [Caulobacteraceae bacterium]|nr:metallophosphoesterase [Caulobacteraceae bacterium]